MASYTYVSGTVVRLHTNPALTPPGIPFTSIAGTVVNPDVVTFEWTFQGQTPVTYTYTTGSTPPDPSLMIVKDSTGVFHVDLDTTGYDGTLTYAWSGKPGTSGLDTTKTQVVWNGIVIITPDAL